MGILEIFTDLLIRVFVNFRSSLKAVGLSVIAWLLAHGVELSSSNAGKITALTALVAHALWNLFSNDPEPVDPEPAPTV